MLGGWNVRRRKKAGCDRRLDVVREWRELRRRWRFQQSVLRRLGRRGGGRGGALWKGYRMI